MDNEDGTPKEPKKKKVKPGSFQGLGLSQSTYKAVMKMGYKMPTPIQRKTIPTILEGQDVVAMARTGSGKTAAFLIPIIERLANHSQAVGIRAVVLSPTRELAMQTATFFRKLGCFAGLRCCLLVGGQAMEKQFEHLANNPDVIIATPGRLVHHMIEAELSLSRVEMLVFDEADRLFELGFADQLQKVLDAAPVSRQCLLFSATLPSQLLSFSRAGIKNPVFVRLDVDVTLSEQLDLWFLYTRKDEKLAAAVTVLRRLYKDGKSTVMFVATRHHVEFFGELLGQLGLKTAVVYGSMDQDARIEQVAKFRKKQAGILVTTDVAARGIDIPLLDHVVNYDFPPSAKLFVHRSGRTARAGRSGLAVSLVTLEDLPYTVELMLFLGQKIKIAEDTTETDKNVLGALPCLDFEVEALGSMLAEEGTLINSLYKSMMSSYHLYYKTRPSASKQSVGRVKELLEACGGPTQLQGMLHPAFRDESKGSEHAGMPDTSKSDRAFIQELRGFRPKLEKVGNVISTAAARTMTQAKLEANDAMAAKTAAVDGAESQLPFHLGGKGTKRKRSRDDSGMVANGDDVDGESEESGVRAVASRKPRISKRRRRKQGGVNGVSGSKDMEAFDGYDVQVDGVELKGGEDGSAPLGGGKKKQQEQFFLSTERRDTDEAKERGLDMEQYQMDLLPDDSNDIKKTKSVMRWDAKKKKYLPVMVTADGRVAKRKNESGQKVKGEAEKSSIYAKWAKSTKKRIQKVGELEQAYTPLGRFKNAAGGNEAPGVVEFGDDNAGGGEDGKTRKPVVPFHGKIEAKYLTHKQKRMLKKRENKDRVIKGPAKKEIKTADQIRLEKQTRDKYKLRQNPHMRKKKAHEAKAVRMKKAEEKASRTMSRSSRAKMLVFEGPKKGKIKSKRGGPVQKGYGAKGYW